MLVSPFDDNDGDDGAKEDDDGDDFATGQGDDDVIVTMMTMTLTT